MNLRVKLNWCEDYPEVSIRQPTNEYVPNQYFDVNYEEIILHLGKSHQLFSLKYGDKFIKVSYDTDDITVDCEDDHDNIILVHPNENEEPHEQDGENTAYRVDGESIRPRIYMLLNCKDEVMQVINELEDLLQNETIPISDKNVGHVMDQVDQILETQRDDTIPGELLVQLDELGTRLMLEADEDTGLVVRSNIAVAVADVTPEMGVRGVRLAAGDGEAYTDEMFKFITGDDRSVNFLTNETDAMVLLPESVTQTDRRISFIAFRTNRPFQNDRDCQLNSKVLSISVDNFTGFEEGEMVEIYLNPLRREMLRNETRVCAYWNFNENDLGHWSPVGCTLTHTNDGELDICRCDHLTIFAEIIITKSVFSETNEKIIGIISIIGCCLSIFGITLIVLTAARFKQWRTNDSNKVWLHLSSAIFLLNVCFLLTVFISFEQIDVKCTLLGVALHYSVLATFCWMLVVSILSYRKLVLVFTSEIRRKLLFTSMFAWGFPFLIIGILLAVDSSAYTGMFEEMTPNGHFCYPRGVALFTTVFTPVGIIWFVNWILYGMIIKSMFASKKVRRHSNSKDDSLRSASVSCLLAFLCGIPWVFGFFASNIVAAYLFTLTASFQGFVLFLFFIPGNKKTRNLWLNSFGLETKPSFRSITGTSSRSPPTSTVRYRRDDTSSIALTSGRKILDRDYS